MQKLAKHDGTSEYSLQVLADEASLDSATANHLVPLARLADGIPENADFAVLIPGDTAPEQLTPALKNVKTITIEFSGFMDGRGFSLARILRDSLAFEGELQASGGYMQDQLFYLKRCGFDAFIVADDADIESMQQSLNDFSNSYQASADQAEPLFRRR